MARYQIILAYDGTQFAGFQRQGKKRTVQVEVEMALRKLGWQAETILAAGRTDRGVHAVGQVVAFDLDWPHATDALGRAMNAHLPPDVAVKDVKLATADFHPRYQARARCYQYFVYCDSERQPLLERYAWRVWPPVDLALLQMAASSLVGVHNFVAFGAPMRKGGSTVREVYRAGWEAQTNGVRFEVSANAFLYHMVRRMVYLQVMVGQRRLSLDELRRGIENGQSLPPGLAPAQGLVLSQVDYLLAEHDMKLVTK